MASKKNTLKELNQYLQDQKTDSTIEINQEEDFLQQKPNMLVEVKTAGDYGNEEITSLVNKIREISAAKSYPVREIIFQLVQQVLKQEEELNASDVMLLNTILYLEHNEQVKNELATLIGRK